MSTSRYIDDLLSKYYSGASSPEEEISLYIALLEEPEDSPYKQDLKVLEGLMMVGEILSTEDALQESALPQHAIAKRGVKRWFVSKYIWSVAASLALLLVIGTSISLWNDQPEEAQGSWRNAQPIDQEEVNKEALRAFGLLDECLSAGSVHYVKAQSTIEEASDLLEVSYRKLAPMALDNDPFATPFDIAY